MKSYDLRSVLELLKTQEGQYLETDRLVDARAEIAGIYRKLGAGGTVRRPTRIGPAMMFRNVKDYDGARILIGVLGSRKRVGTMLGIEPEHLSFAFLDAVEHPVEPVVIDNKNAVCQEQIYYADDPDFDLRKIIPAPLNTERDAGPYITMGLCHVHDPETKESNIAHHRMCIQGRDTLTVGFGGARHMGAFYEKAKKMGTAFPIAVSIGVDPAISIAACFQAPTTPLGYDELAIAGAIRKQPVELVKCKTIDEFAIANAEYVIEGELSLEETVAEDQYTNTGWSMPEFVGYNGKAKVFPVLKVKAVTCRTNPIMQICIGASEEHVNMAGIAEEASILQMTTRALAGKVKNVHCPAGGGGKLMAILQIRKETPADEGKQKQAALLAFGACAELKNVFLVDEDVDIFDPNDVMWAFNTRFKPELDMSVISNVRCHISDPTQKKEYDAGLRSDGLGSKTIYDCTVPFEAKEAMTRAVFMDVDVSEFE